MPAGELERPALGETAELHQIERLAHSLADLPWFNIPHTQAEADVLSRGHVGEERVVLEYDADIALERRQACDRLALEINLAGERREEAGDQPERRRLAAARRPEQRHELAFAHLQIDSRHSDGRAVALLEPGQAQLRHARGCRR